MKFQQAMESISRYGSVGAMGWRVVERQRCRGGWWEGRESWGLWIQPDSVRGKPVEYRSV